MKSLNQKIAQLAGLVDTKDVSAWENGFLVNVVAKTEGGMRTAGLTDKQLMVIDRIYGEHFA